jgi:MFS transporter, DHA1 family, inner membrane transport protein
MTRSGGEAATVLAAGAQGDSEAHEALGPHTLAVLSVIVAGPLVSVLNAIALVPFLPVVAIELETSVVALGQVTAASNALATALGLVAGQYADRYGYRPILLLGVATVVISAFGSAAAPNFGVLLLAGLVGGVSRAVVAPISTTIAGTWFKDVARPRALGLVTAAAAGAAIVGLPLLTTVAAVSSWRVAFMMLGVAAVGVVLLTRWGLPETRTESSSTLGLRQILVAYRPLLRSSPTTSILGSNLLRSIAWWTVLTYIVTFLVLDKQLTVQQGSLVVAAAGAGLFVGSLVASVPLRVLAPRRLLVGSCVIGTSVVSVSMALPVPTAWIFGMIFADFVVNGMGGVAANLLLLDETPAGRATTMSLNGAVVSFSSALGGLVGGLLLAFGGYTAIGLSGPGLGSCSRVPGVAVGADRSDRSEDGGAGYAVTLTCDHPALCLVKKPIGFF